MNTAMAMGTALPDWLKIAWTAIYVAILLVHARHVIDMAGQERAWHAFHLLMALGMIALFFPFSPDGIGVADIVIGSMIFAFAALAISGWIASVLISWRSLDFLWIILVVDILGMAYMFLAQQAPAKLLFFLFAAYFAVEACWWALGVFSQADSKQRLVPVIVGASAAVASPHTRPLADANTLEARLTLGLMAVGMAFMFIVMFLAM
jgi:hypothetical protein